MNRKERRAAGKTVDGNQINQLFSQAISLHQAGRIKDAIPLYRKVTILAPQAPEPHHNLGIALKALGKIDQAIQCYLRAFALNPSYADAANALGNSMSDLGRHKEALDWFDKAVELAPHAAAPHNNRGTILLAQQQWPEAVAAFRQAIQLDPHYAEAHNNLGAALVRQDQLDDALAAYDRALVCDPHHPRAHANRAALLLQMQRLDEALKSATLAVQLTPQSCLAQNTLGTILQALNRLPEAAQAYEKAIAADPSLPEQHDNLGNVLGQMGLSVQAEQSCRQALKLAPDFAKAWNNLGTVLKDQGKRQQAEACFLRALELAPHMSAAHTNLGMSRLYFGDFATGWQEFEWRWNSGKLALPSFTQPRWMGENLYGKTILLTAEQGLGDSIQFARFAEPIAALGATVILQVQPSLTRLLATIPGVSHCIGTDHTDLPAFDYYLPLLSAPLVLNTRMDTIPATIPYLQSAPQPLAGSGRKIGLVWSGDPRPHDPAAHAADLRRSIPLADFIPVLRRPDITWFSLQMGPARQQMASLPPDIHLADAMEHVQDFTDTANIVAGLDLVITVDTSIAHLAGALGKPVWVLSRFDGCWRWLESGETSPWYPRLRLFRQSRPGEWGDALAQVAAAL